MSTSFNNKFSSRHRRALTHAKLLMIGQMHLCTFIYSEEKKLFNEIKIEAWLKEAEKYDFICISEMFVHFVLE